MYKQLFGRFSFSASLNMSGVKLASWVFSRIFVTTDSCCRRISGRRKENGELVDSKRPVCGNEEEDMEHYDFGCSKQRSSGKRS